MERPDVAEPIWRKLCAGRFVPDELIEDPESADEAILDVWNDLVAEAVALQDMVNQMWSDRDGTNYMQRENLEGHRVSTTALEPSSVFNKWECEYAFALSLVLSRQAAKDKDVLNFRELFLGYRLMTLDQAYALVRSQAAQKCLPSDFRTHGIPLVGHDVRQVDQKPPDVEGELITHDQTLHIEWEGGSCSVPCRCAQTLGNWLGGIDHLLEIPSDDTWSTSVYVWPGSLLDELRKATLPLLGRYRWQQQQAVAFILTGATPRVSVASPRITSFGGDLAVWEVTLKFNPILSPETWQRIHRELQSRLLGPGFRQGKSPCNLAVYAFVLAHRAEDGPPDWRYWMERWNDTCALRPPGLPDWRFADPVRFREACIAGQAAFEKTCRYVDDRADRTTPTGSGLRDEEPGEAERTGGNYGSFGE